MGDKAAQSRIHIVTRSHRALGDRVGEQSERRWGTRPHPCRDKISQSTRRRKQGGRQSRIHVVTRSHRALGDRVGQQSERQGGGQGRIHVVTRSRRALGDTVGDTVRYGKIISRQDPILESPLEPQQTSCLKAPSLHFASTCIAIQA